MKKPKFSLTKLVFGRTKLLKHKKRKILLITASLIMFLGVALQMFIKADAEVYFLGGFGLYTLAELYGE